MITPWSVNSRLYASALTRSPPGVASSRRIMVAAAPPMKKKTVIAMAKRMPIRL